MRDNFWIRIRHNNTDPPHGVKTRLASPARILTSMYKLARNPLLDRPVSFRSYTFDATPLLRMREEEEQRRQQIQPTIRRRSSGALCRIHPASEPVRKAASTTKPKTFWKSSKINSRIKTCISNNGTIKERNWGYL